MAWENLVKTCRTCKDCWNCNDKSDYPDWVNIDEDMSNCLSWCSRGREWKPLSQKRFKEELKRIEDGEKI